MSRFLAGYREAEAKAGDAYRAGHRDAAEWWRLRCAEADQRAQAADARIAELRDELAKAIREGDDECDRADRAEARIAELEAEVARLREARATMEIALAAAVNEGCRIINERDAARIAGQRAMRERAAGVCENAVAHTREIMPDPGHPDRAQLSGAQHIARAIAAAIRALPIEGE